jgi:hypothetical protein
MTMREPLDTMNNTPAIITLNNQFDNAQTKILDSSESVLRNFDFNSELKEIYTQSYTSDYCNYFNQIKIEFLNGIEKLPCANIFPGISKYVSLQFFNFFNIFLI